MAYIRESGVPLGGLGAGKVDLCPDGAFRNVTIQNNLDWPYSGKGDQVDLSSGRKTDDWDESGLGEAFFAAAIGTVDSIENSGEPSNSDNPSNGSKGFMLKAKDTKGLPGVPLEKIEYNGCYPFVNLKYPAINDVNIEVNGFSPLLFDDPHPDYLNSSLPTSIFTLKVVNTSKKSKKVGLAFSFPQIVGMGGITHCRITDPRGNVTTEASSDKRAEIQFSHRKPKINQRVEGQIAIAALAPEDKDVQLKTTNGWWYTQLFEEFIKHQALPDPARNAVVLTDAGAVHQGTMGAVGATKILEPGESWEQRFVLAWNFPNRPCNDGPKVYRNMYSKYFGKVDEVLDYVQENLNMLETETKNWQKQFTDSNLPDWFVQKLCNNISHFSTGSVYIDDGRGAFNESPVIMNGCMGTIDQRLASHGPCTIAFPKMAQSELDMFIDTQIQEDDPKRYAPHWNQETGEFDSKLDRVGAVKHNIGRDDFEGGKTDHTKWLTTHWPDRVPGFILELYMQAAWTGDIDYLKKVYPNMLSALEFQKRLDQNNDGIGDLWGHGCCTFDSRRFQLHGATPFVGSLHLAALRCLQKIARILGDEKRIPEFQKEFDKAQKTMEEVLWNEEKGQYDKWADTWYKNWDHTDRKHGPRSEVRMTAQLAGNWFVPLLDLEPILDAKRIEKTMQGLYEHNCKPFSGCMTNETGEGFVNAQSWPYYAETFFAAPSILSGNVDQGMDVEERFANTMSKTGRHWDLPLSWDGENMDQPLWGRWYMSTPSSWFVLQALTGIIYDGITKTLTIRPRQWSKIGHLKKAPVFHPLFWAQVSTSDTGWSLEFTRLRKDKLEIQEILLDESVSLKWNGEPVSCEGSKGRFQAELVLDKPGELVGSV